ncbi:SPOR domain-containing protein [Treponema sp. TIM-1]|uniref:RlpA-like double-psi beta-barrel domain-containing protein n=1 Tax=Treponema sp. TIM-1 TaxID=2898417 RepID=UPI003981182C
MKRLITSCLWGMFFIMLGFAQTQEGRGTWYDTESKGLSASHSNLPFGTRVRITNLQNDRQVIVTIDNRIADTPNRIVDISRAAADNLGMNPRGTTPVRLEVLARRQTDTPVPTEIAVVPPPEPTVNQPASSPTPPQTVGIEVKSDPSQGNPGMVNQTIITFNGMPGYSQNEGSASLTPAPSLTSSGGRQVPMMPEPVATAQEVPVPIPFQPEPVLRSPEPVVVAPQPMIMQPSIIAPVVVPPVVVPPVLAPPVLAEPILTPPVLAEPVLTPPVLAEPVLTPPVVAEPILSPPVLSPPVISEPVVAGPITTEPIMSPPLVSPMVTAEPMVATPIAPEPLTVSPTYMTPAYTDPGPTGLITPEPLRVPPVRSPTAPTVVQVTPRMPDPRSGKIYRLQVGAFSNELNAREAVFRLREVGFDPAYELYGGYCRVVLTGIRAADVEAIIRRVGAAGFIQVFIREES